MYDNKCATVVPPLSTQIRSLRSELGLTLREAAERAGTSAPTMHRYESGWDRFELPTLRRVAAALDADVEVRLVRRSGPAGEKPTRERLIAILDPLFWDRDLLPSDLEDYPGWVLERVLVYGDRRQVDAARHYFGDEALAASLDRRGMDARTRNYWRLVLEDECIRAC
ncbi:MAG: helix-turn-helix domain-containing protein [Gemmatimonadota bacterium]